MIERRLAKRAICTTSALITFNKIEILGNVENLSLDGMYLRAENQFDTYQNVDIKISYHGEDKDLSVLVKGVVSRRDEAGMGIQFKEMTMQSFKIVKDIVKRHHDNPEEIEKEMIKYMVK